MSKGILNNRDKMIWDNTHKPDISDVVPVIDDEMDDLLEDHDDKVVDIVGDNMNDLLDAHDDKVVSIVGNNMSTLLTGAASTVRLLAGDKSGITSTPAKIGTWDATHDIYAFRATGNFGEITTTGFVPLSTLSEGDIVVFLTGYAVSTTGETVIAGDYYTAVTFCTFHGTTGGGAELRASATFSNGTYDVIVYFIRQISS